MSKAHIECPKCHNEILQSDPEICPFCGHEFYEEVRELSGEGTLRPQIREAEKLERVRSLRNILVVLLIICMIGLPIVCFLGYSYGANAARFDFYYVQPEQRYGVDELDNYLKNSEWISPYQKSTFDCSGMSAYLEWDLENQGFRAVIVAGSSPFGSGRHAWLLVETSVDAYMPVEATTGEVVWWSSPYFDNYFVYDHRFETIQEALAYSETEFDWWNSP
jgi:hypothetical protein